MSNSAESYGVRIEPVTAAGPAWRVVECRHLTPEENRGGHNVYVDVADYAGVKYRQSERIASGFRVGWFWDGGPFLFKVLDKPDTAMEKGHGDVPIGKGARLTVWVDGGGLPSDRVTGLHTNHPDERAANGELLNTIGHHSFYIRFQRTMAAVQPAERTGYIAATQGLNLRSQPSTDAPVLTTIRHSERVTIIGAEINKFLPARWQNLTGFLFAQYVSFDTPVIDDFARAVAWVLKEEGGYTPGLPGDPGGETNWGISKRSYPHLDIKALTLQDAIAIYRRDYWLPSGANALPWPASLAVFDGAVQHGAGVARDLWRDGRGSVMRYMGLRLEYYADAQNISSFEKPWSTRMGRLLLEVGQ